MKVMSIGIFLVVIGCSILGWLIKEAYKNNKDKSTKNKILYLLWVILGVLLVTSGLIVIVGFIFLGVLLIIYHPIFS
jgi:ABC-type nickel/cobalt efflux system permease component RcnA